MERYDVIVVGAGPTGENVAGRVAEAGLRAVIVEGELVGGECSYWACVPSKALLRPGVVLAEARAVQGAAGAVRGGVDAAEVLARRDRFAEKDDSGQAGWLESVGVDLVRGWARITGERTVEVGGTVLEARVAVVVCTGSVPVLPPIPGLADVAPWGSREATSAERVPDRLAILGGGVVGVEMATAYRSLGAEVTLLVRGRVLDSWEPFAGEAVVEGLRAAGVDVRLGVSVARASRAGHVTLELTGGGTLECDEFLVAAGRVPRTGDLGLEAVGLPAKGALEVDDSCQVTAVSGGWLYACGDVTGRAPLTHMGKYEARACAAAIAARAKGEPAEPAAWAAWSATADHTAVPQVVFGHPEVAAVGLTEDRARAAGLRIRAVEVSFGSVSGAGLLADGYEGSAKLIVDEDRGVVVGCTLAGQGVGELIHAATVAIVGEVPLTRLWHAVPAFPTASEIWLRLLEAYGL